MEWPSPILEVFMEQMQTMAQEYVLHNTTAMGALWGECMGFIHIFHVILPRLSC